MHSFVITIFLRPIYFTTFVTCICAYDDELYHVSQTYDNCSFLYPVGLITQLRSQALTMMSDAKMLHLNQSCK